MLGFCGTFDCTIDDKGRLLIPARIHSGEFDSLKGRGIQPGEIMILSRGLDGCLSLYPQEEWTKVQSRFESLSFTSKDYRFVNRFLHEYTSPVKVDRSGRILIPEKLRELAKLGKDVLVIGANQSIEIWDPIRHEKYEKDFGREIEDVAEGLFHDGHDR